MKRKVIVFCSILLCCIIVFVTFYPKNKYNKYAIEGAAYITEKNRHLIGTETEEGTNKDQIVEYSEHNILNYSSTIKSIPSELHLDSALISDFITKEKDDVYITPEIILTNGSIGVFTKEDGSGWLLNKGDSLTFNFNKYESKAVKNQNSVIGYVVNGKMVKGEGFKDLSGNYKTIADESGEYYIYVLGSSSDYLSFKEGRIIVE